MIRLSEFFKILQLEKLRASRKWFLFPWIFPFGKLSFIIQVTIVQRNKFMAPSVFFLSKSKHGIKKDFHLNLLLKLDVLEYFETRNQREKIYQFNSREEKLVANSDNCCVFCFVENVFCVCRIVCTTLGSTCHTPVSDWCSFCANGGTCIETLYGTICQCTRFWMGTQCKEPVTCRDMPCNQATMCRDYVSCFL